MTDLFLPKIFLFSGSVFPWRPCYELLMECNCTKQIDKELKYIIFIRIYMYIVTLDLIYWNKIIVIIQQFLFLGMTAPCEILEYELHLTLEQIKEEPVDNADSTQVRICRNINKYFYLLNAHPWNNVWLLAWLQILSQHVWKKNFIHKVHCSSNFLHL